jgi:esterase/lipase superfamily enzyme
MSISKSCLFYLVFTYILSGCVSEPPPMMSEPLGRTESIAYVPKDGSVVEIFYGTNRVLDKADTDKLEFGSGRSDVMHYGKCLVSVPPGHQVGVTERPWFKFSVPNPEKHMMLALQKSIPSFDELAKEIRSRPGKKMFVFIHGYNVPFIDAALRTAQMTEDLSFDGTPIFFSWPAKGVIPGYFSDSSDIEWAASDIRDFLQGLIADVADKDIYIIAHSMGTRGVAHAIEDLIDKSPQSASKIKEVILAAPDIDEGIFKRDIMPAFSRAELPTTIYASDNDKALKLSSFLNGYVRVGSGFTGSKNLEVVDATKGDTDFLGHSYFATSVPILNDLFGLINYRYRAEQRFMLRRVKTTDGQYWELKP